MPANIADRIVERAGGNPFFAGELVRAYEASRREGANDADIVLPDTVHATVLARIDGLPDRDRKVLEYAAVTGRTARAGAIGALLPDLGADEIAASLEALLEREFLVPQAAGAYTFRHIVIREVAYATLPRAERVRGHLRLASWLGEEGERRANELSELIAYHYRQALALTPGGRLPEGLAPETVVVALERAARLASAAGAYAEARQHLDEAIRLAPEADRLRLYELLGDVMQFGDDAIRGYAEAFERWRATDGAEDLTGARLLAKRLGVAGRWAGSLTHPLEDDEFERLATLARRLLESAPDDVLSAKLACAIAFQRTRAGIADATAIAPLERSVNSALDLFIARDDAEAQSEALDALAAVHRAAGDYAAAADAQRRRLTMSDRLGILERIDAFSVLLWDLVYLGQYRDAVAASSTMSVLRPGEPEYVLAHATAWATYAAMLCGQWDRALELADRLVTLYEDAPFSSARFTYPGWAGALRVAKARQDETRVARYRSVCRAVANLGELTPDKRRAWEALIEADARAAREALAAAFGTRDRKGELVALILLEARETISEEELVALERQSIADPPALALRIALARALSDGAQALRAAIARLDEGELVADAARAAALLALRTNDNADRAEAERRLRALGDRDYLQKLAEEW